MNIVFPIVSLGEAGGERVVVRLAEGLARRGHRIEMIVPRKTARKIIPDKSLVTVREVFDHLPFVSSITDSIFLASAIPKADIIFATAGLTAPASVIASKILRKGKLFYYIQHYEPLFYKDLKHLSHYLLVKNSYRFFYDFAVDASWINEVLRKEIGREGKIINPGFDPNVFHRMNVNKSLKSKTVLYLGRKGKLRDPETFFRAMEMVAGEIINLKLINVTNDRWDVSKIAYEYEEIQASGKKLAELYNVANVYVLSSTFEGCPMPPIESMACGTPVVTTDCMGTRDYAKNSINSLVVEPKNPTSMAEAIVKILKDENLSNNLSAEGLQTANKFSIENTIEAIEQTLKAVVEK